MRKQKWERGREGKREEGRRRRKKKRPFSIAQAFSPEAGPSLPFFFHLEKTSPPLQIPQAFLSHLWHEGRKEPLSTEAKSSAARLAMLHPGKGLGHVVPMAEISFSADTLVKFLA